MNSPYRVCTRCVMDTSAGEIDFDAAGRCNYCIEFEERYRRLTAPSPAERSRALERFVERVKRRGQGKPYDCIVGVSGGLDSSWTLVHAVRLGLRPLAVHMDNGWNSELAQSNIENLVKRLGVDLYTHVIDWNEYRALMQSFFDADVVDVELLYDNAMLAVNYQQAVRRGVRHILGGTNEATEGMRIPTGWNWFKFDARNIRGIARRFSGPGLRSFPAIGAFRHFWYQTMLRYRWVSFLDFHDYHKADALDELTSAFGYKPYPYKHYESVFTRFYQAHILPRKFGIDKRRLHFSTLIVTGQMQREEALRLLQGSPYPTPAELEADRAYFIKKMRWTDAQLEAYLSRPAKPHSMYPSERAAWIKFATAYQRLRHAIGAPVRA